mmetsp:Transcript_4684/g.9522  ORF Transcript_4684/g.9522 Transcript_4684/m.9522 type:complete len:204 (+) Transcript_4684:241-852(+)
MSHLDTSRQSSSLPLLPGPARAGPSLILPSPNKLWALHLSRFWPDSQPGSNSKRAGNLRLRCCRSRPPYPGRSHMPPRWRAAPRGALRHPTMRRDAGASPPRPAATRASHPKVAFCAVSTPPCACPPALCRRLCPRRELLCEQPLHQLARFRHHQQEPLVVRHSVRILLAVETIAPVFSAAFSAEPLCTAPAPRYMVESRAPS